ncbi:MAG: DUF59 domain-containing protein [Fimbriimonadaceae bacterium]|nr:DUF59 domain-containing protein [Fimbriimonadaceae bacterium]QYK55921.1 MAG: DUF59 domain-containing protein [Fimbriimonadaceae bacterium]
MPEKIPPTKAPPLNPIAKSILEGDVIESIRQVYDPEIPVNVYDLGLIYSVMVHDDATVDIKMTLTSPACPVAGTLPGEVEQAVRSTPGVRSANLELVWDPPFTIDRIPEHIRLELGLYW